ncbi:hypothetical protein SCATT_24190 [Streptantibioticus cattleyicolor NRRL 8057 = DSM 46488]|uniref:Uncharacterized protein n=1 Tax=Streptantibioticus cattleyicolor (strain ATCC 35852 / DSM 46488 / JCM 4925 / NBRC 14057 / NRRL 8057) TaxID=1003195 RepID=G8WS30_STREN|nr:hypothetical protein SCATT_24190 [Streptantibioticus cattleyicolor NRRL 8057 = DSM 46488]
MRGAARNGGWGVVAAQAAELAAEQVAPPKATGYRTRLADGRS